MTKVTHKFHYLYKVTLLKGDVAGHYYYGQHSTNNLNDGYIASGTTIINYFKVYEKIEGVTYVREILNFYDSLDDLNKAEAELIGDKYKTDPMCLNRRAGGNKPGFSEESRQLCRDHYNGGIIKGSDDNWHLNEQTKKKISAKKKGVKQTKEHVEKRIRSKVENGHTKLSEKSRKQISEKKKGKHRMYVDDNHYIMV